MKLLVIASLILNQVIYIKSFTAYASNSIGANNKKDLLTTVILFRNVSEGQVANISIILREKFTNNNKYVVTFFRQFPKKTKLIYKLAGKGACSDIKKYLGGVYADVAKLAKVPNNGECPVEKGHYVVNELLINYNSIPPLAMLPNGKYRANIKVFELNGVLRADITIDLVKL